MDYYDPKEVRLIVNGLDITGFTDGDKIKIEPVTKEQWKSFVGVDGNVAYSKNNDERHMITFTLQAVSPSNAVLDALRKLPTSFATMIKNASAGQYIGGGTKSRIVERPGVTMGNEKSDREWKILVPNYSGAMLPDKI